MAKMNDDSTARLFGTAGFREESSGQPLVYGYVHATQQMRHVATCRRVLERYCQRERLRLCTVFVDRGVADDVVVRPGLVGLCDVLRLPDSFAAVLVSMSQLSQDDHIADRLVEQIRRTGARLLFARRTSNEPVGSTGQRCTRTPEWWQ
jgi:hypothetical protein